MGMFGASPATNLLGSRFIPAIELAMPHAIECRQLVKRYARQAAGRGGAGTGPGRSGGRVLWPARAERGGQDDDAGDSGRAARCDQRRCRGAGAEVASRHADEIRERIGISLQETRLADKLTVRETVTLFRSFYRDGIDPDEAISRVSLEEKANSWIVKLSGGQKQRLAVAVCARRRSAAFVSRRADDGPRSAVAAAAVGGDRRLQIDRPHGHAHDALHGRGRAAVRPGGDRRSRQSDRPGNADGADCTSSAARTSSIFTGGSDRRPWMSTSLARCRRSARPAAMREAYSLAVEQPHVALPALLALLQRRAAWRWRT